MPKDKINQKTRRLRALDKKTLWHPFTQMRDWERTEPLIIERGSGSYLIDTEGRRYLDGVSSLWVTVHGHRKGAIDRALKAQIDRIAHSTLLGLGSTPSIELGARLIKIAPKGLTRVFYSDNGSTAVEIALKMAFQYWAMSTRPANRTKRRFIAFTGAYHGDTFGAMGVGEIDVFVKRYRPLLFKALRAPYPYCYRCPVKESYPGCKIACLDVLEEILKKDSASVAACIIEPLVQGAAGMITAPPGFLRGVRRLTKRYNVLLIADEVATGFGRTGSLFACEAEDVRPDLLCLAKGLTAGYMPLAATITTEKIYKAFLGSSDEHRAFYHGHTYTGNPLGCAAALANLEVFRKERVITKLRKKIRLLKKLLEPFKALDHVGDVRQRGFMIGIELVKDKKTKRRYPAAERMGAKVCEEALKGRLIIRPLGDTVVLMPPLGIKEEELKRMAKVTYDSIVKVTE
jgi:adenosylmethionine-8-amino-7-oxononanoate aminotransferase